MAESEDPTATAAPKRRRRRQQAPVEEVVSEPAGAGSAAGSPRPTRWQRWRQEVLSSFGLSPAFRAYVFIGSILAILAFLLYNEWLISELREQEKSRVDLYAKLISLTPLVPDEQAATIFTEVITNPRVDFPIIITNASGQITLRRGVGLRAEDGGILERLLQRLHLRREDAAESEADTSAVAVEQLRRLMAEMDAKNPPIPYYLSLTSSGLLYQGEGRVIITDTQGEVVRWRGPDLPASVDTAAAARQAVGRALERLREKGPPLEFEVPAASFSYLHYSGNGAVIIDDEGQLVVWRGPDLPASTDTTAAARSKVRARIQEMGARHEPLAFRIPTESYIHYGDSELVSRISLAPFVQIGVLMLFLLVGYIGFRNIKRSEQRSIWVGMAKETAHQLGTPLSSLSGWLELIRHEIEAVPAGERGERLAHIEQMVAEMDKDMSHLNQIASRFSQIGSVPELRQADVGLVLEETVTYFRHRGPQFGRHEIRFERRGEVPSVPINAELLGWAFENLVKNSLDAMERRSGTMAIELGLAPEGRQVQILFKDDGRGIDPENLNRIFEPGFSTKKRGWGLGLAFVKRIVEEYHKGRISVVQSVPGEGTTFEIVLPVGGEAA